MTRICEQVPKDNVQLTALIYGVPTAQVDALFPEIGLNPTISTTKTPGVIFLLGQ